MNIKMVNILSIISCAGYYLVMLKYKIDSNWTTNELMLYPSLPFKHVPSNIPLSSEQ